MRLTELVRARKPRKTCLQGSISSEQLIEKRGCLEVDQETSEIQILWVIADAWVSFPVMQLPLSDLRFFR